MKLQVNLRGEKIEIQAPSGARLLDYLQENNIPINAACGGNGTCHKCRIKVTDGFVGQTMKDKVAFRDSELAQGWRLSCQCVPKTNLALDVPSTENFKNRPRLVRFPAWEVAEKSADTIQVSLVCDLGSTGVVVALADLKSKKPLLEAHLLNRQVRFGADVMTRLHHAQTKGVEPLRAAVLDTLRACLDSLKKESPALFARAFSDGLYCSGNSAMTSFLLNWSIDTLAVAPFQPATRDAAEILSSELDGIVLKTLPILAGFVGGDTVSGILCLEGKNAPEPWMLVDIGTNTEIVVNNGKGELWFSSAPAGPAFEGGNISQGMRAENGAISIARYSKENSKWNLETIGDDVPRGICGSGLIDILFESVQAGLITEDGYIPEGRLDVAPELGILADDVREFQLAKSATRTASDLLIERSGITPKKIYLAGTFAQNLRADSVKGVGLLPQRIEVETIGNASLYGVILYAAMNETERKEFNARLERSRNFVELALQDDFQDRFVKNLNF